jgi:hypothetical protein
MESEKSAALARFEKEVSDRTSTSSAPTQVSEK